MKVKHPTVLIPGASRPIGRAIARMFANAGFELFLPYYDWAESIAEMQSEFDANGFLYTTQKVDLRNEIEVQKFIKQIKKKTSALTVLINNIERGGMPIVHGSYDHSHNKDQWEREYDTTVKAKYYLYKHCKKLLQQSKEASILNISSIAAEVGRSGPAGLFFSDGYSCSNRAISGFTSDWARELSPEIRVNELKLGMIDSRHGKNTRGWQTMSQKEKKQLKDHILLKRTGLPEEVAEMAFFISTKATYMTGAVVKLDGGYTLGGDKSTEMPPGIL